MEPQQPLVCPSHVTHYVIVFILGALIGAGALVVYGANNYQKGFEAARKLVADSPMGMVIQTPADTRMLSGVVTAVGVGSVIIKTQSTNPFVDPSLLERTITIGSDTKITKRTLGDMQAFRATMDDFMKKMQSGKTAGTPPTPPEPVITPIELSSVVVGDTVTVATLENVATMKSFPAIEIQVQ